ncbi:MAG: WYL domain-containing protein, partial [SAR324 cluster bacterium]|nr:WYL domain-containing protein [SAR324 cluster bacterium]
PHGYLLKPPEVSPDVLYTVYTALLEGRKFTVNYTPRGEKSYKSYSVNPLGLVFRESIIYLVCSFNEYDTLFQLPLHRMRSPVLLEEACHVPADFDLDAYIQKGAFQYLLEETKCTFKALLTPDASVSVQESLLSEDQQLTEQPDGRIMIEASVQDSVKFRRWLLGFGDTLTVLEPPHLKEYLLETARNILKNSNVPLPSASST